MIETANGTGALVDERLKLAVGSISIEGGAAVATPPGRILTQRFCDEVELFWINRKSWGASGALATDGVNTIAAAVPPIVPEQFESGPKTCAACATLGNASRAHVSNVLFILCS